MALDDALTPILQLAARLPLPILVKSPDGTIQFANSSFAQMIGRPVEDLVGQRVPDREAAEMHAMEEEDKRALAGEVVFAERYVRDRPTSGEAVYQVIKTCIPANREKFVVAIGVDITPVRTAQAQLQESELQLRSVWEASVDGMRLSAGRTVLRVNDAYCRMTGCSRDTVEGSPVEMAFAERMRPNIVRETDLAMTGAETQCRRDEFFEFSNGASGWFDLTRTRIEIPGGPVWLLAIFRDVTEKRMANERLAESARLAEEAASELEEVNRALRNANEEARLMTQRAEALSGAKSDFLAAMSHEIRTPLHGILGMTELALQTQLTPEQREYLELIRSSGDSLLLLLNDILDYAKAEAGRMELDMAPFSVREMIDSALRPLALRAAARNLILRYEIDPPVPDWVSGDALRLRQVLLNVAGNAIKFTHKGSVQIFADVAETYADSVALRFRVKDTGIGIPPEKQATIFEPFRQADSSTSRRYGGTGLGLSISATLIQMMHGRIWVQSEAERGSTFWFTAVVQTLPGPAPVRPAPTALRLLVAEDNVVSRSLITRLLERAGHRVEAVTSGREALDRASNGEFDAVLMDLNMPEMDGIEAARRIRAAEAGKCVRRPIVALTADHASERRAEALAAGMDAILTKPFQESELMHLLDSVLRKPTADGDFGGASPRLLDKASALARAGGDTELLAEIAGLFLADYPESLRKIRDSLAVGDLRTAEREAHSVKGSVANFGAAAVVNAALAVETAAREGRGADAGAGMAELEQLLEQFRPELEVLARS